MLLCKTLLSELIMSKTLNSSVSPVCFQRKYFGGELSEWFRVVSPFLPLRPGSFRPGSFRPRGGSFRPSRWVVSPLFIFFWMFKCNLRYNIHILYTHYTWRWVVSPSYFFSQFFNEKCVFQCVYMLNGQINVWRTNKSCSYRPSVFFSNNQLK